MPDRLDWYTTHVLPEGGQEIHIRATNSDASRKPIYLNREQTRLFMTTLDQLANDTTIPYARAKQAVLRAFADTLASSR